MLEGNVPLSAKATGEPEAIFKPNSWLVKIDFINQLVLCRNVLLSIVGEHGAGKSTFVKVLASSLDQEIEAYSAVASALFVKEVFLSQLAAQLSPYVEPTLESITQYAQQTKKHILVMIDDAQNIPENFLNELLIALQKQQDESFFHVCLVSNYSLVSTLNELSEIYEEMIHSIELGNLNEKETKSYVREKLAESGYEISEEELAHFYQLTEGDIVGINTQMRSYFETHEKNSWSTRFNHSHIRFAGIAAGVFAGFILAYVLFTQPHEDGPAPQPTLGPVAQQTPMEMHVQPIELPPESSVANYQLAAVRQDVEATSLKRPTLDNEEDPVFDNSMVVMDKVVVIPKVEPRKATPAIAQPVKVAQTVNKPIPKAVSVQKPSVVTKPVKEVALSSQAASKPPVNATAFQQKANQAKPLAKAQTQPLHALKDKFTIQLLASRNASYLNNFAHAHQLHNVRVLRTQLQGMDWFVLTTGVYDNRVVAKQALYRLPQSLTSLKPWIRGFGDLKQVG